MANSLNSTTKIKPWTAILIGLMVTVIAVMVSRALTHGIDSSGFKPAPKITEQGIEQQIQDIQNNPSIPEAQKPMIIGQIRSRIGTKDHH